MAEATYRCGCGNVMVALMDDQDEIPWDKTMTITCDACGAEALWEEYTQGERSGDHVFLRRVDDDEHGFDPEENTA